MDLSMSTYGAMEFVSSVPIFALFPIPSPSYSISRIPKSFPTHRATKKTVALWVGKPYKSHSGDKSIVSIDRERQGKLTRTIWKKLKHRAAIEPIIGHLKSDCRLERNYLLGEAGNAINAILSAAGYNFRKLLKGL